MKKAVILILIVFSCLCISGYCNVEKQLEGTDISGIEKYSGGYKIREKVYEVASGKIEINIIDSIKSLVLRFTKELKSNFGIMGAIILIALISAVAENIRFELKSGNDIIFFVFFALITLNGLQFYSKCLNEAYNTMDNLLLFINALYPVMLTTLAAGGGVTSAATLHPVLMVCGGFVMMIIKSVIMPLLSVTVALQLSNSLSTDFQAKRMADFINGIIKWTVGIMMTLFVGVVSVSGAASQSFDSVTVRAAKYAIGSFIPMVGGVISDSFDLVLNGSGVIKSSVGLAGLINILFLCVTPCIKLSAIALAFNICAAVIEPICNKKITDAIGIFAKSAFTLFGIICAAACMFILCTGVLISIGVNK